MTVFADEVETYLAGVPVRYREPLRAVAEVLAAKLGIQPKISYGIIAFTLSGKYGIYISGWKDHMSFHGGHFLEPLAETHPELFTRKGATLWFQDQPPLPEAAIDAVIAARLASMPEELIPENIRG
jgi:uncharacterized protein YdhG (YjbR/CyaY superfamily)